jgi:hypothetical protein
MSISEIAAAYDVTYRTALKHVAYALATEPNLDPAYQKTVDTVRQLFAEKKSLDFIAKKVNMSVTAVRGLARRHGIYKKDALLSLIGLPIGCPACITHPFSRQLCANCYSRFMYRKSKGLIDYPEGRIPIFEQAGYKVYCNQPDGTFEIESAFMGTLFIEKPSKLETVLLNHIYREFLITLDKKARETELELGLQNPLSQS